MEQKTSNSATQYLFFKLNQESYAIKANIVKEIVDYIEITKIPKAHTAVLGVTNIRGDIVPIVDPKIRFEIEQTPIGKRTSFIILNIFNTQKQKYSHIAIIVDLVDEVDDIDENDILPTPKFGTKIQTKYIESMIRYESEDEYVTVIDPNTVIDIKELSTI
jgi:purine-binding chemotaxis protein CheW